MKRIKCSNPHIYTRDYITILPSFSWQTLQQDAFMYSAWWCAHQQHKCCASKIIFLYVYPTTAHHNTKRPHNHHPQTNQHSHKYDGNREEYTRYVSDRIKLTGIVCVLLFRLYFVGIVYFLLVALQNRTHAIRHYINHIQLLFR